MDLQIEKENLSLRERVQAKLRHAVLSGHFQPGQRLIERELCKLLGVGRTSIREAMRQLEAEGLIATAPHRGPVVSSVSVEEAEQLYALRALLESYAGRKCAERATQNVKDRLGQAAERFVVSATNSDTGAMIEAKADFYDLLIEGTGNVFVKQTLQSMYNRISMLRTTSLAQPGRFERSASELREIARAIGEGRGADAEAACRRHTENAANVALTWLRANADGSLVGSFPQGEEEAKSRSDIQKQV